MSFIFTKGSLLSPSGVTSMGLVVSPFFSIQSETDTVSLFYAIHSGVSGYLPSMGLHLKR